jgi:hypothetical protein
VRALVTSSRSPEGWMAMASASCGPSG